MCICIYVHRRCRLGSRLGKLIRYPLSPLFAPNPPHPGGYGGLALASPTEDAHRIVTIAHVGPPAGRLSVCTCGLSAQNFHHHKHDHQQADFQSVPAGFQPLLSVRSIGRQTFSLNLRAFSPEPPQPQTQLPAGRLSVCTCGLSALDFQSEKICECSNIQRGDGGKPLPHTVCGRANPIPPCAPCGRRLRT